VSALILSKLGKMKTSKAVLDSVATGVKLRENAIAGGAMVPVIPTHGFPPDWSAAAVGVAHHEQPGTVGLAAEDLDGPGVSLGVQHGDVARRDQPDDLAS
jgi:hypothetical protein